MTAMAYGPIPLPPQPQPVQQQKRAQEPVEEEQAGPKTKKARGAKPKAEPSGQSDIQSACAVACPLTLLSIGTTRIQREAAQRLAGGCSKW